MPATSDVCPCGVAQAVPADAVYTDTIRLIAGDWHEIFQKYGGDSRELEG